MTTDETVTLLELGAPTPEESEVARDSSRRLAALLGDLTLPRAAKSAAMRVQIGGEDEAHEVVVLPRCVVQLLARLLAEMAEGHAISLVPHDTELTPRRAAEMLGVSRPYLVRLLDEGRIPFRYVGTHRRVLLRDLLDYKSRDDVKRGRLLDALAAQAQAEGMGY